MRGVGCLPPSYVSGCTVRNNTDGDVQVHLIYKSHKDEIDNGRNQPGPVNVAQGQAHRAEENIVSLGSYDISKEIEHIEVTHADGRKTRLSAPFEGVRRTEPDWLFVIDNDGIKSVGSA